MDTPTSGYVTALIANERIKFFTVSGTAAKATDSGNVQQIDGLQAQAHAGGRELRQPRLKRKALKRFSQFGTLDLRLIKPAAPPAAPAAAAAAGGGGTPGQGDDARRHRDDQPRLPRPAAGRRHGHAADPGDRAGPRRRRQARRRPRRCCRSRTSTSTPTPGPARSSSAAAWSSTCPARGQVALVNPEVVIGATNDASGLFATIDGVRVKVGDIDTEHARPQHRRRHGHDRRPRRHRRRRARAAAGRRPRHRSSRPARRCSRSISASRSSRPYRAPGTDARSRGSLSIGGRDRRAAGPDRARSRARGRPSTACSRLHRAYLARVPYEDLAVQLGETGPLDEAALAARVLQRRPRRLLLRAQHGAGGAAARASGSSSPTTRRSSAAKARRTTWRCSCTSTASAGSPTPASARASSTRCRSARALRRSARSPTRSSARPADVVDGPARVGLVHRLPDGRGGVRRWRTSSSTTAGSRTDPESRSCKTLVVQQPRADRIVTLRARTLSASGRRSTPSAWSPSATSSRRCCSTSSGSRWPASGWSGCGRGLRPARGVPGAALMRVATHPGNFHADDVFAVAVLGLVHGALESSARATRRRWPRADVRVDIGGRSDPATGDFDHHQRGGAGERPNGIRYASFGLVWRGVRRAAGRRARSRGGDRRAPRPGRRRQRHRPEHLDRALRRHPPDDRQRRDRGDEPAWDEELTAAEEDERFAEAVALATGILERELRGARAYRRALDLVRAAIERAADPRLVELDRKPPWHETVVTTAPEALYVVYPKSDGWGMQAVPKALGEFENRKDLPEAWAGHADAELAADHRRPGRDVRPHQALLRLRAQPRGHPRPRRPGARGLTRRRSTS